MGRPARPPTANRPSTSRSGRAWRRIAAPNRPPRKRALQRREPLIPLGADVGHPRERIRHRLRRRAVEHLAARAPGRDEAGVRQRAEVLLDRLTRDGQLAGEIGGARLAALAEQREEPAPRAVAQRLEYRIGAVHQRSANAALISGAGGPGAPTTASTPRRSSSASGRLSTTLTTVVRSSSSSSVISTREASSSPSDHQKTSRCGSWTSSTKPLRRP